MSIYIDGFIRNLYFAKPKNQIWAIFKGQVAIKKLAWVEWRAMVESNQSMDRIIQ